VPFWREFLLQLGICDVSKASIVNHLARGPGSAVMIVVGGAEESLCAETGTYHLNLRYGPYFRVSVFSFRTSVLRFR
jgi:2-acylglycerol O-acyltransferase 2